MAVIRSFITEKKLVQSTYYILLLLVSLIYAQSVLPAVDGIDISLDDVTLSGNLHLQAGYVEFLGIPYAVPPIGELRFKAPIPFQPAADTLEATSFGPGCMQLEGEIPETGISEDCLTLNVWAPSQADDSLPVIVFVHGGGYIAGSSAAHLYWGDSYARRGDAVFVTLNYRLGLFGFVDVAGMATDPNEYFDSANNGLRDQLMALAWVKNNIAEFGGDPNNITIMGESAGAGSIAGLMAVDNASDFFQRAVILSRPALISSETAFSTSQKYQLVGSSLGLTSFSDWLAADGADLLNVMAQVMDEAGSLAGDRLHGPVFGSLSDRPRLIPTTPEKQFKRGSNTDIDLLIGTTMDETRYYSIFEDSLGLCEISAFDNPLLEDDPLLSLGALIMSYIIRLDLTNTDSNRISYSEGEALLSIADEIFFRIPTTDMVNAHAIVGGNSYAYILDYPVNFPNQSCLNGSSPHGSDLAFVFDRVNDVSGQIEIGEPFDSRDQKVREDLVVAIQDAIVAFAKTGNPNVDASLFGIWPRYEFKGQSHLVINEPSKVVNRPFWIEQSILKVFGLESLDF